MPTLISNLIPHPLNLTTPWIPSLKFHKTHSNSLKTHFKSPFNSPSWSTFHSQPRRTLIISSHLRRCRRRNSLRPKLLPFHRPTPPSPNNTDQTIILSDFEAGESNMGSEKQGMRELGFVERLERWLNQCREDIDYWGVGFGPIFVVTMDCDGNVERVSVDEDEIVRRISFEVSDYEKKVSSEEFREVNLRISYAKGLAKEMECGNYVILRNSSVAKFVVSGEDSSSIGGFRSVVGVWQKSIPYVNIRSLGIAMVSWFLVLLVAKVALNQLKGFWNEMMRKRMEKEKEKMGAVEVVKESVEAPMVRGERPSLDKEELWNSIRKAEVFYSEPALLDIAPEHEKDSSDLDHRIQEIRDMARKAREVDRGGRSKIQSADRKKLASSEPAINEEIALDEAENLGFQVLAEDLSTSDVSGSVGTELSWRRGSNDARFHGDSSKKKDDNGAIGAEVLEKIRSNGAMFNGDDRGTREINGSTEAKFSESNENDDLKLNAEVGSEANVDLQLHSSTTATLAGDQNETDAILDCTSSHDRLNLSGEEEVLQPSIISSNQSSSSNEMAKRRKSKVMLSVKEAREYLAKKHGQRVRHGESNDKHLQKESTASNELLITQRLQTDVKGRSIEGTPVASGSGAMLDSTPVTVASKNPCEVETGCVSTNIVQQQEIEVTTVPEAFASEASASEVSASKAFASDASASGLSSTDAPSSDREQRIEPDVRANEMLDLNNSSETSDPNRDENLLGTSSIVEKVYLSSENDEHEGSGGKAEVEQGLSSDTIKGFKDDVRNTEMAPFLDKETWVEKNFDEFEPVLQKIGAGFRNSYEVAREKASKDPDAGVDLATLRSIVQDNELDWMNDDELRKIVFKVRDNELAGLDPFHSMEVEDKDAFFKGLERKVEAETEKLATLHQWLHENIENLDYGADGISVYDPIERIVPRWKGPPVDEMVEFLNRKTPLQQKSVSLQKTDEPAVEKNISTSNEVPNATSDPDEKVSRRSKTVIQGSDGSVRPGKKHGKEYWEHTKKYSRGFLEVYNAEQDPEVKATMREVGKDLDRWVSEDQVKAVGKLADRLFGKKSGVMHRKMEKFNKELEMFGPQAVVSKYREYADEKEEDYLWWLDLRYVLCLELYTQEKDGEEMKVGFYSLDMAPDLELDPKPQHVIAFENPADCKNMCHIIRSHMKMLGKGKAFVVAQPPKDVYRLAKANGFSVTVIRKGQLLLNVDQPLEEVEELITEIGSKMYHDQLARERSIDVRTLMNGIFGQGSSERSSKGRLKRLLMQRKRPSKS